jgi:predicted transcriptional regulator
MTLDLKALTADIVSSYLANNPVSSGELPELITTTHAALSLMSAPPPSQTGSRKPSPSVIRKSITPDGLISFEDGRPYKTLKRHLSRFGLTPDEYREKWGLPFDYPIVAPSYAQKRSQIAHSFGFNSVRRVRKQQN